MQFTKIIFTLQQRNLEKELYDNIIKAYKSNAKEVNITSGKDKVGVSVVMYPCNFKRQG